MAETSYSALICLAMFMTIVFSVAETALKKTILKKQGGHYVIH